MVLVVMMVGVVVTIANTNLGKLQPKFYSMQLYHPNLGHLHSTPLRAGLMITSVLWRAQKD